MGPLPEQVTIRVASLTDPVQSFSFDSTSSLYPAGQEVLELNNACAILVYRTPPAATMQASNSFEFAVPAGSPKSYTPPADETLYLGVDCNGG